MGRVVYDFSTSVWRDQERGLATTSVKWWRYRTLVQIPLVLGLVVSTAGILDTRHPLRLDNLGLYPDVIAPMCLFLFCALMLAAGGTDMTLIQFDENGEIRTPCGFRWNWFRFKVPGGHEDVIRFAMSGKGRRFSVYMKRKDGSAVTIETRLNYYEACRLVTLLNTQLGELRRLRQQQTKQHEGRLVTAH